MIRYRANGFAAGIASLIVSCLMTAARAQPVSLPAPEIEDLGDERYRIGEILVDRAGGAFSVPGRVIRIDPAIEYLAVMTGGIKAYESLLELDTDAYQFNLACILIGLSTDGVVPPEFQFDPDVVIGPRVRVSVQWREGARTVEHDVSDLLHLPDEDRVTSDWVYTGSTYVPSPDEPFLANQTGTLIGLMHDPASIIEHSIGVGIDNYGAISGNTDVLPSGVGMELTLRVEMVRESGNGEHEAGARP
jgi:hypothetical protein